MGTRPALLVSLLVEGAEAGFLKPTRKTGKRACPDTQLRRTTPSGSPRHLSGQSRGSGSYHQRARRELGARTARLERSGLPGAAGGADGKPRLRTPGMRPRAETGRVWDPRP